MKHRDPSPREIEADFLERQAEVAQAVSGRQELSVMLGLNRAEDEPLRLGDTILAFRLAEGKEEDIKRHIRAQVDLAALALKYHRADLHHEGKPRDPVAASLYDALEQVRLETLGGRRYPGMKHNLAERARVASEIAGHARMAERSRPPLDAVVSMIARKKLTGEEPPASAAKMVADWTPFVEKLALKHMDALSGAVNDQKAFSRLVQEILFDLKLITHRPANEARQDESGEDELEAKGEKESEEEQEESPARIGADERRRRGGFARGQGIARAARRRRAGAAGRFARALARLQPPAIRRRGDGRPLPRLHHGVRRDHRGGRARPVRRAGRLFDTLMQKVRQYHTVTSRLATRLQRLLLAQQARQWDYELEDGLIDNARPVAHRRAAGDDRHLQGREGHRFPRHRRHAAHRQFGLDARPADHHRRAVGGYPGAHAGALRREGRDPRLHHARLEGRLRAQGVARRGRPRDPGRLNDLRHIIYKSADQRLNRARRNLGLMLKDGILKENIDGEAILWAASRLKARREQRKILMVISDGAPVDDSTLSANSGGYLDQHLRRVIATLEREGKIELLAIGIGHDVTRYYSRAVTLHDVEQLGDTMLQQITALFTPESARTKMRARRRAA
ncbi:MAG: hypothetical protein WDN72_09990 [Alphaproteobacteria bacterium]